MLKIQELREIIRLVDQSSINEFNFEQDGSVVSIKKSDTPVEESRSAIVPEPKAVQEVPVEEEPKVVTEPAITKPVEEVEPTQTEDDNLEEIISPMVGTFYRKPGPDSDTFVEVGSTVQTDSVVCIVEAMKLFNEIEAETKGEIVEVLVGDGELVEYGQPLFKVKSK